MTHHEIPATCPSRGLWISKDTRTSCWGSLPCCPGRPAGSLDWVPEDLWWHWWACVNCEPLCGTSSCLGWVHLEEEDDELSLGKVSFLEAPAQYFLFTVYIQVLPWQLWEVLGLKSLCSLGKHLWKVPGDINSKPLSKQQVECHFGTLLLLLWCSWKKNVSHGRRKGHV